MWLPLTFTMSAKLDNTRMNREVHQIMDKIVDQLMQLDGADIELSFEVWARVDDGIPVSTSRAISENCNTLHIKDFRFDEYVGSERIFAGFGCLIGAVTADQC